MPTVRDLQTNYVCGLRSHYQQIYIPSSYGPDVKAEITDQLILSTYDPDHDPGRIIYAGSKFSQEEQTLIVGITDHYMEWKKQIFPGFNPLLGPDSDPYPNIVRQTYEDTEVEENTCGYVTYQGKTHLLKFVVTSDFSAGTFDGYIMADLASRWVLHQVGLSDILYIFVRKKLPAIPETLNKGGLTKRKNIDTTEAVYQRERTRLGLKLNDYLDILSLLSAKGNTFFSLRPMHWSNRATFKALIRVSKLVDHYMDVWPNPSQYVCFTCPFRDPCRQVLNGQDIDIINSFPEFRRRDSAPTHLRVELDE